MKRRAFLAFGITAGWSLAASAQRTPARLGFLGTGAADTSGIFVEALRDGLRDNGLQEGRDYILDFGWAEGDYQRFPQFADRMVRSKADVILATTITAVRAAQRATTSIPIVMTSINDPVGNGVVKSLARPDGNTTGLASLAEDVSTKLVELLQATIPNVASIGIVLNPANPSNPSMLKRIEALIGSRTVRLRPIEIRLRNELDSAFAALRGERLDALLVLPDFMLIDAREAVIAHSLRLRMPAITNVPEYTDAGALVSYGASRRFNYRRSAYYVKRILDGVKPADLPIEQPAQIELSVNLKTANKLGISIPKAMLTRADRVID